MENLREHLASRHLDMNVHQFWTLELPNERCVVFPLWNLSGQLVGYQRYRPDKDKVKDNDPREGRYFTRVKDGRVGVWGLESWNFSNTLYLTEGVFDAARLTEKGQSAIAVLSCDPPQSTRRWLSVVRRMRPVVAVCDNDEAGRKLTKFGHVSYTVQEGDLGDASDETVNSVIRQFTNL